MNNLKGYDELNAKINALLNKGLHTDIEYLMANDFCYLSTTDTVHCSFFAIKSDEYWQKFIGRKFGLKLYDYDMWIFSVLHEIGHYNTLDEVTDRDYNYSRFVKWIIERPFVSGTKLANDIYFGLPDEIIATAWAVRFFRKHKKLCRRLSEQAFDYIKEFYTLNNITED